MRRVVAPRVTVAMRRAAKEVLESRQPDEKPDDLLNRMLEAVVSADDTTTRWCALIQTPTKAVEVYGPYATYESADLSLRSGLIGTMPGSKGAVRPLFTGPKNVPAKMAARNTKKKKETDNV